MRPHPGLTLTGQAAGSVGAHGPQSPHAGLFAPRWALADRYGADEAGFFAPRWTPAGRLGAPVDQGVYEENPPWD
ncbi:MAG TPA: hypothetical protein VK306_13695 [Acidimicrobiales bacterium]|nr:hypothetical protein [Acidimicrobiales bacterium]